MSVVSEDSGEDEKAKEEVSELRKRRKMAVTSSVDCGEPHSLRVVAFYTSKSAVRLLNDAVKGFTRPLKPPH
jgi:hypothetical protein